MASLGRKYPALLIALCLFFSMFPGVGSALTHDEASVNESLQKLSTIDFSSPAIPRVMAAQISESGATFRPVERFGGKILQASVEPPTELFEAKRLANKTQIAFEVIPTSRANVNHGARVSQGQIKPPITELLGEGYQTAEEGQIQNAATALNRAITATEEALQGAIKVPYTELLETQQMVEVKNQLQKVEAELPALRGADLFGANIAGGAEVSEQRLIKPPIKLLELGQTREKKQIQNVVAALRRAGLFGEIAGTIEGLDLMMLPQLATMFVPTDSAYQTVKQADRNLQLFQYHVVLQRYAFAQLLSLKEGDILFTFLPGFSIVVTKKRRFNYTLDDVKLISPDLYMDETIVVHGIDGVFNCTVYGKGVARHDPATDSAPPPQSSVTVSGKGPASSPNSGSGSAGGSVQKGGSAPPLPFTPLGSEFASDISASLHATRSVDFGTCAAITTVFVCMFLILCY